MLDFLILQHYLLGRHDKNINVLQFASQKNVSCSQSA